jgi:PAS domain S-box-containing protein
MQAPETDEATNQKIRDGIRNKADVAVTILNKRKDGSTFWNQLFVAPVVDQHGEAKFFVGVQRPIKVLPRGGAETPAEDDEDGSSGSA